MSSDLVVLLKDDSNLPALSDQLKKKGFTFTTKPGYDSQLLLFLTLSSTRVARLAKEFNVEKYLNAQAHSFNDEPLTDNDRTSLIYNHLMKDLTIESIENISPAWEYDTNKTLLLKSFKWSFTFQDVLTIRKLAGDNVGLYFEFLRFYYQWLHYPAIMGLLFHFILGRFSLVFCLFNCAWCMLFIQAWNRRERVLKVQWNSTEDKNVENNSKITINKVKFFPIMIGALLVLFGYQVACFFIEILLTEVYQGSGKMVLGLAPTVLIVAGTPVITGVYNSHINNYVDSEGHNNESAKQQSKTEKLFLYNFLSSYVPLLLTSFFYIPFGNHWFNSTLPYIHAYSFNLPMSASYHINMDRLVSQFAYFTLTAQVVSFIMENVVPVALRLYKQHSKKSQIKDLSSSNIVQQMQLPHFDTHGEYRELAMQFGFLALFSPVWSLAPIISLVFNWIEIRGDLEKLLFESTRPIPRTASMKPWDTHLKLLTLIGNVTSPMITLMYGKHTHVHTDGVLGMPWGKVFGTVLFLENISLVLDYVMGAIYSNQDDNVELKHKKEELSLRQTYVNAFLESSSSIDKDATLEKVIPNKTSSFRKNETASTVASKSLPIIPAASSFMREDESVAPSTRAVLNVAVGDRSSTPSSRGSGSLAGATLPPEFEKRLMSSSSTQSSIPLASPADEEDSSAVPTVQPSATATIVTPDMEVSPAAPANAVDTSVKQTVLPAQESEAVREHKEIKDHQKPLDDVKASASVDMDHSSSQEQDDSVTPRKSKGLLSKVKKSIKNHHISSPKK